MEEFFVLDVRCSNYRKGIKMIRNIYLSNLEHPFTRIYENSNIYIYYVIYIYNIYVIFTLTTTVKRRSPSIRFFYFRILFK